MMNQMQSREYVLKGKGITNRINSQNHEPVSCGSPTMNENERPKSVSGTLSFKRNNFTSSLRASNEIHSKFASTKGRSPFDFIDALNNTK